MDLKEKVAYLKGFVEGKKLLEADTDQSEVLAKVLELLDDMAEEIKKLDEGQKIICRDMDDIDDDLYNLECYVYDDEDFDDDYDDDDDFDDYELVACPHCGTQLELEEDDDKDNLVCPNCGKDFTYEEGLDAIDEYDAIDEIDEED